MPSTIYPARSTDNHHTIVWWFVLLSIALHTLLIVEWNNEQLENLGGNHIAPISVAIISAAQNSPAKMVPEEKVTPKPVMPVQPKLTEEPPNSSLLSKTDITKPKIEKSAEETPDNTPSRVAVKPLAPEPIDNPQEQEPPADTTSTAQSTLVEQQLLSEIKIEFSRYFKYPPRALRKQLEGQVVLSFRLDADGIIQHVVIEKSSGHGILDRSAIASLTQITPLSGVPSQGLSFKLPIVYKLHNG